MAMSPGEETADRAGTASAALLKRVLPMAERVGRAELLLAGRCILTSSTYPPLARFIPRSTRIIVPQAAAGVAVQGLSEETPEQTAWREAPDGADLTWL